MIDINKARSEFESFKHELRGLHDKARLEHRTHYKGGGPNREYIKAAMRIDDVYRRLAIMHREVLSVPALPEAETLQGEIARFLPSVRL